MIKQYLLKANSQLFDEIELRCFQSNTTKAAFIRSAIQSYIHKYDQELQIRQAVPKPIYLSETEDHMYARTLSL